MSDEVSFIAANGSLIIPLSGALTLNSVNTAGTATPSILVLPFMAYVGDWCVVLNPTERDLTVTVKAPLVPNSNNDLRIQTGKGVIQQNYVIPSGGSVTINVYRQDFANIFYYVTPIGGSSGGDTPVIPDDLSVKTLKVSGLSNMNNIVLDNGSEITSDAGLRITNDTIHTTMSNCADTLDVGNGTLVANSDSLTYSGNSISVPGFNYELTGNVASVDIAYFPNNTYVATKIHSILNVSNGDFEVSNGDVTVRNNIIVRKAMSVSDGYGNTTTILTNSITTGGISASANVVVGQGLTVAGTATFNGPIEINSQNITLSDSGVITAGTINATTNLDAEGNCKLGFIQLTGNLTSPMLNVINTAAGIVTIGNESFAQGQVAVMSPTTFYKDVILGTDTKKSNVSINGNLTLVGNTQINAESGYASINEISIGSRITQGNFKVTNGVPSLVTLVAPNAPTELVTKSYVDSMADAAAAAGAAPIANAVVTLNGNATGQEIVPVHGQIIHCQQINSVTGVFTLPSIAVLKTRGVKVGTRFQVWVNGVGATLRFSDPSIFPGQINIGAITAALSISSATEITMGPDRWYCTTLYKPLLA